MAAPTDAPKAEEDALEVVATIVAAEPPARGAAAREDTAIPPAAATEATGSMHTVTATDLAAPTPQKIADRTPTSLS